MQNTNIQLGCGLIRIGRTWGFKNQNIPSDQDVQHFLSEAVKIGIRFFDTAPAYGSSEQRLGTFLKSVPSSIKNRLMVATKCGEYWDVEKQSTYVDHTYEALVKSINSSNDILGKVDMLQIHKATPSVLQSDDIYRALEYARTLGINRYGASISDLATAKVAVKNDLLSIIQIPYNPDRHDMKEVLELLKAHNKQIIINRPFNMGEMVYKKSGTDSKQKNLEEAYAFILKEYFNGYILTGTGTITHLKENYAAFTAAHKKLSSNTS